MSLSKQDIALAATYLRKHHHVLASDVRYIADNASKAGQIFDQTGRLFPAEDGGVDHEHPAYTKNNAIIKRTKEFIAETLAANGVAVAIIEITGYGALAFTPAGLAVTLISGVTAAAVLNAFGVQLFPLREVGTNSTELIIGNPKSSSINLLGGDDVFLSNEIKARADGGRGDDFLIGGRSGKDTLQGNIGNDTIIAPDGALLLRGGNGNDWLQSTAQNRFNGEKLFGDRGSDTLIGSVGRDLIFGDDRTATTGKSYAGGEADQIIAGSGKDTVLGGTGNDTILGDSVAESKASPGESGAFAALYQTMRGKFGSDGGAGEADRIAGNAGNDLLAGGNGNDTIYGDDGVSAPLRLGQTIFSGTGNDTIYGDRGADEIYGGWGNDHLRGGADNDKIFDSFYITGAVPSLPGGETDNDRIYGEGGNDSIVLGHGRDTVYGGVGNDTVSYESSQQALGFEIVDSQVRVSPKFNGEKIFSNKEADTIKDIEEIVGTKYDDAYFLQHANSMTIKDESGSDRYVISSNMGEGISVYDDDGAFSLDWAGHKHPGGGLGYGVPFSDGSPGFGDFYSERPNGSMVKTEGRTTWWSYDREYYQDMIIHDHLIIPGSRVQNAFKGDTIIYIREGYIEINMGSWPMAGEGWEVRIYNEHIHAQDAVSLIKSNHINYNFDTGGLIFDF